MSEKKAAPHGWLILDKPRGLGSTQAVGMVKKGGAAVLVGVLPISETVELSASDITLSEKRRRAVLCPQPLMRGISDSAIPCRSAYFSA